MKNILPKSIIILFATVLCTSLSAQIIYVNTNAPSGGDGTSWASAYHDLQPALTDTENGNGDEIWVAQGSYFIIGATNTSFEIPNDVEVYGGFIGGETNVNSRDWENNETILDGANAIHTIVYFLNSNSNTILDGFTIQQGFADGVDNRNRRGGAIYIEVSPGNTSDPKILNCTFKNNYADELGGAVYVDGESAGSCSPLFENCVFDNNSSFSSGAAVYVAGNSGGAANPTFSKCIFTNNDATGSGGAMFFNGTSGNANSTINKCIFDSNSADQPGGAIYSTGSNLGFADHTIINCRFFNNSALAAGAIYNNGGPSGQCSPSIINCTFHLNAAVGSGGTGGAIYSNGEGGGVSSPLISNCIIYGNIGPFNSHVLRNVFATPTIRYSLVDLADCTELSNGNDSNVTCGDGMLYETNNPAFEDASSGDLRLQNTSDAIDAGNDNDNNETEDLDCEQRKINTIDMGAYEAPDQNLPVELAEFLAYQKKDKVVLLWVTLSEENNAYFTIERSANGRDFEALETVQGAGTTYQANSYERYDHHPIPGENYYRIKNTSFSGEIEYSPIRIVEISSKRINVFPNPVENHLTIAFSDFNADEAQFEIYDIYGKQVHQGNTQVQDNVSFISLPEIGGFVPGTYILKVHTLRNGSFSHRFIKIRD